MVSTKRIGIGFSFLIAALMITAGGAAAQANAVADAGGEAAAAAQGAYHADATGATDAAEDQKNDAHAQAVGNYKQAADANEKAQAQAYAQANQTERPERPQCDCDEAFDELEQAGSASLEHTDEVQHAQDVETEYVDAGGDVSAFGHVGAWFSDAFDGASDAYDKVKGVMGFDTNADQEAKAQAKAALDADDELNGQVEETLETNPDLPDVEPKADGQLSADHATKAASSAAGDAVVNP